MQSKRNGRGGEPEEVGGQGSKQYHRYDLLVPILSLEGLAESGRLVAMRLVQAV